MNIKEEDTKASWATEPAATFLSLLRAGPLVLARRISRFRRSAFSRFRASCLGTAGSIRYASNLNSQLLMPGIAEPYRWEFDEQE